MKQHRSRMRRNSTSLLATALLLVLALFAAACGSDDGESDSGEEATGGSSEEFEGLCQVGLHEDADGPVEVTLWHAWVGLTRRTVEQIAADYNASQDKVVIRVEAQGNYEEQLQKYEQMSANASDRPDLLISEDTTTQFMIDSQTAIPAQACIEADPDSASFYDDDLLPAVRNGYTVQDVLWPAFFNVSQPVLYVNEAHLEAAGLDTADLPETLDELRAAAQAIKDAGVNGVEKPLVLRLDAWLLESWSTGVGQDLINNNNGRDGVATESLVDNEVSAQIFNWIVDMEQDGLLNAIPYSDQYGQLFAMALGSSSMLIDTSTAITSVNGVIEGTLTNEDLGAEDLGIDLSAIKLDTLRIGVGLNPGIEAPGLGQIGGAAWYLINNEDPVKVAAVWDFIRFATQEDQLVDWTLQASYLPIAQSAREHPLMVEEFETTMKGNWLSIASQGLDNLDPNMPGPVMGPYNLFRSDVRGGFESAVGGTPVAEVIQSIDASMNDALAQYADEVS